jgi:hypothetical protein
MDEAVKAVLLVIYLIGAICTAWCLSVPTVSREHRSFLRVCLVIWPFIVTVFGVFALLALLAEWYNDRLALARMVTERISSKAPTPLSCPTLENDSQARTGRSGRWSEV